MIKCIIRDVLLYLFPAKWKEWNELKYWKSRIAIEGQLSNDHYIEFYTTHFGLEPSFYRGKRILDIGCGPRGSLEWADMVSERIGLDPLTKQYLKLGADQHKMKYVAASSELIPFEDNYFDVVSSFNSLDHVVDLDTAISEIKRVLKPGGLFLLLTDVNHEATAFEPQEFSWDIVQAFLPSFKILDEKHYEKKAGGMYRSIQQGIPYNHSDCSKRYGVLSVKFCKLGT